MPFFTIESNHRTPLPLTKALGFGKEGTVYQHPTHPNLCVKIYHGHHLSAETQRKIEGMILEDIDKTGICWPKKLVFQDGDNQMVGYTMPKAEGNPLFYLLDPPSRAYFFPIWGAKHTVRLALKILEYIEYLAQHNVLVGEISEKNIQISGSNVYFLNTDKYPYKNHLTSITADSESPSLRAPLSETHWKDTLFSVYTLLFKLFDLDQIFNPANETSFSKERHVRLDLVDSQKGVATSGASPVNIQFQNLFHNIFKRKAHVPLDTFKTTFLAYLDSTSHAVCPSQTRIQKHRHDIIHSEQERGLGSPQNILIPDEPLLKIAVLELSTRACKLLIANVKDLIYGFSWSAFANESYLTNTGHFLDRKNHLSWETFEQHVLPAIKKLLRKARLEHVNILYCVATAALRSAHNKQEILSKIKAQINLNIQILDRHEEANATISAFQWGSSNPPIAHSILLDQGGGSTELSAFSQSHEQIVFKKSTYLPIGTTSSINILFQHDFNTNDLASCLLQTKTMIESQINELTHPLKQLEFQHGLIGVGSALTEATQKKGNRIQHNTRLNEDTLILRQEASYAFLLHRFQTLDALKAFFQTKPSSFPKVQKHLVSFFGLGMILKIMNHLDIAELTVNGLGLRYGICHQHINAIYPDLLLRPQHYTKHLSTQLDGLIEGSWLTGTISNISPKYGLFVQLNDLHTGLLHLKELEKENIPLNSFQTGDTLRVYLKKIHTGIKPKFFLQFSK